ncbi:AraC family transcriptional regulator, partial [Flavobacteriaceae bacterium]|nr:AraC family transcriptional regulator [Flavobacteriaceae bacterium]
YINTGVGKRQVGTHLSNYQDGDLILIGSYLPHTGFTKGLEEGQKEIVIQFKPDIFEMAFQNLEELKRINQLLELSKKGIVFDGSIKEDIGIRMEGLQYETQIDAFLTFVKILHDLAKEKDKKILNAEGYAFISNPTENKRLKMIFNYIRDHFMEPIALEDISAQVFMTPQSFCRFFKKSTQKTFTNFLNEYRINHATKLLSETDVDIKTICYESGFNNLSNFFRNFKKITQLTPNAYRDEILGSTKNE